MQPLEAEERRQARRQRHDALAAQVVVPAAHARGPAGGGGFGGVRHCARVKQAGIRPGRNALTCARAHRDSESRPFTATCAHRDLDGTLPHILPLPPPRSPHLDRCHHPRHLGLNEKACCPRRPRRPQLFIVEVDLLAIARAELRGVRGGVHTRRLTGGRGETVRCEWLSKRGSIGDFQSTPARRAWVRGSGRVFTTLRVGRGGPRAVAEPAIFVGRFSCLPILNLKRV